MRATRCGAGRYRRTRSWEGVIASFRPGSAVLRQWPKRHCPLRSGTCPRSTASQRSPYDGLAPFELGVAVGGLCRCERPGSPTRAGGRHFAVCAERPGSARVRPAGFAASPQHGLGALAAADTVVVPGCPDPRRSATPAVAEARRAAHARGARLVSSRVGRVHPRRGGRARRARGHGRTGATPSLLAAALPARPRAARLCLYVDGGDVLTSLGTAAGTTAPAPHSAAATDRRSRCASPVAGPRCRAPRRGQAEIERRSPVAPAIADDPVGDARAAGPRPPRPGRSNCLHADGAPCPPLPASVLSARFRAADRLEPRRVAARAAASRRACRLLERADAPVEEVGRRVGLPRPARLPPSLPRR